MKDEVLERINRIVNREYNRLSAYLTDYTAEDLVHGTYINVYNNFFQSEKNKFRDFSDLDIKKCLTEYVAKNNNDPDFKRRDLPIAIGESRKQWLKANNFLKPEQCTLLWECVREVKKSLPSGTLCTKWGDDVFLKISAKYNERRIKENIAVLPDIPMKTIIEKIGKRIRDLGKIRLTSFDDSTDCEDGNNISLTDTTKDENNNNTIEYLIEDKENQEREQQIQMLQESLPELLNSTFLSFKIIYKDIYFLDCLVDLNQTEIGEILEIQQYKVSRYLRRCKEKIFMKVVQHYKKDICSNSEDLDKHFEVLNQIIYQYYYWGKIQQIMTEITSGGIDVVTEAIASFFASPPVSLSAKVQERLRQKIQDKFNFSENKTA